MSIDISKLSPAEMEELRQHFQQTPAKPRRRKAETVKYLSEEQLDRFFSVISSVRDVAGFRLIYRRGRRASESGVLELADWQRDADRLRVKRLKGSRGGEYHLGSREVRALRAWLRIRGDAPGPLFVSRNHRAISRKRVHFLMLRYGQLAQIPRDLCHPHALKHSCGTHLLSRGETLEDVKDHLGHTSIKSTELYSQFTNRRRQERDRRLREW